MAHISKYQLDNGEHRYRAHVHRKGHKLLTKGSFSSRGDAELWAREQERSISLTGLPMTHEQLRNVTVSDLVKKYLKEVTPSKGSSVSEDAVLNKFLRYDICKKSLAAVKRKDVWDYIAQRQKETFSVKGSKASRPIKNSTIRRELNSISNIFVVARDKWGYETLPNPFEAIRLKGSDNRRERRLSKDEEAKLWEACQECRGLNRIYVPLAIALALHTAMRLQEIFNLTWQDIDFEERRIKITKSKTDHKSKFKGRTIVLTVRAAYFLDELRIELSGKRLLKGTNRIFPMTGSAFKQAWADVRKRAGIEDLTVHDLRHEAASRFDEAGLTKAEHDLMTGHKNHDVTSRYIHAELTRIQDKLDRYMLDGKTLAEAFKEWTALPPGVEVAQTEEQLLEWLTKAKVQTNILNWKSKAS